MLAPGDDADALGDIVVRAYRALPGHVVSPDYEAELRAVARRAGEAEVAVAVDDGRLVGCVTFAADADNPWAEHDDPDAACFRMLAVDPAAQRRGAGRALAEWCVRRARERGKHRLLIHSTPWMADAHRLYRSLGFVRRPDLDETPVPGIDLLGFALELEPSS